MEISAGIIVFNTRSNKVGVTIEVVEPFATVSYDGKIDVSLTSDLRIATTDDAPWLSMSDKPCDHCHNDRIEHYMIPPPISYRATGSNPNTKDLTIKTMTRPCRYCRSVEYTAWTAEEARHKFLLRDTGRMT